MIENASLPAASERADSPPPRTPRLGRLARPLRWGWIAIRSLAEFLLIAWGALAINFSNLPWGWLRLLLTVGFATLGAWALWFTPRGPGRRRRMRWAFAAAFAAVAIWFVCIPPSHDRAWRPDVAVMPRAAFDEGDDNRVRITGFRNFDYRSRDDFTARYEQREFHIDRVTSLDLFISYWMPGPVAHTFVRFNFDDGTPPMCISIECRPEVDEGFDPLASMFKQFELIYVVGDERDIVGVRAAHRGEQVYLYPIRTSPQGAQRLLRVYLARINELADRAEWYHLLKSNCSLNIVRYANAAGRQGGFDLRHLLNGWVDRYLYEAGSVDTTLPFAELRRRANITAAARAAGNDADFSKRIRAAAPTTVAPMPAPHDQDDVP
jgi:hypothetical protein